MIQIMIYSSTKSTIKLWSTINNICVWPLHNSQSVFPTGIIRCVLRKFHTIQIKVCDIILLCMIKINRWLLSIVLSILCHDVVCYRQNPKSLPTMLYKTIHQHIGSYNSERDVMPHSDVRWYQPLHFHSRYHSYLLINSVTVTAWKVDSLCPCIIIYTIQPLPKVMADFFRHKNQHDALIWFSQFLGMYVAYVSGHFLCKIYWLFALTRYASGSKGDERIEVWTSSLIPWG